MNRLRFALLPILSFGLSLFGFSQTTIYLENPSFEESPGKGRQFITQISGWQDCGILQFPAESPPDIHPSQPGAWGVSLPAQDGQTYLGLVTRYNDTWESVSQGLLVELRPNTCYAFQVYLCLSPTYLSQTLRSRDKQENFSQPVILQIWGGNSICDKRELLAVTPSVDHADWKAYNFVFRPQMACQFITLEAFYSSSFQPGAYNGHILVDHLSPIQVIKCE